MGVKELKQVINDYNFNERLCKGSKFDLCYYDIIDLIKDSTNVTIYIERNYVKGINVIKFRLYRYM